MKIKPTKQIQNLKIKAYHPDGSYIGMINNEIQLMDFQIQVKETGVPGYYISYQGCEYVLNTKGRIPDFRLCEDVTISKQLRILVP